MTDQELQQLAREIATENYKHFGDEKSIDLMAHEYEAVIKRIARTHCIVSRETILSQHAWYMQRMKEVSSARQTNRAKAIALEAAFGAELFEERSGK